MESPAKPPLLGALAKSPTSPGFRQLGQRWRLSRCDCRARAERAYDRTGAYVTPLRRSTRRYSSQRDEFHHELARWRLSRPCRAGVRPTSAYVPPQRRSTRRYSSQRDKFHQQFALLAAARQVPPSTRVEIQMACDTGPVARRRAPAKSLLVLFRIGRRPSVTGQPALPGPSSLPIVHPSTPGKVFT